jgi:predicted O-methyltransferase YrrM
LQRTQCRCIAEIGIYRGYTSSEIAKWLAGEGELHLFDFDNVVQMVTQQLASDGYTNVRGYGNSYKYLDSYNWSLATVLQDHPDPLYDFIYIDGAHTWAVDGFATLLADRLLLPGGYLAHDDYNWTLARSPSLNPAAFPLTARMYTDEQIRSRQVEMICDLLIRRSGRYEEVLKDTIWRKVRDC